MVESISKPIGNVDVHDKKDDATHKEVDDIDNESVQLNKKNDKPTLIVGNTLLGLRLVMMEKRR